MRIDEIRAANSEDCSRFHLATKIRPQFSPPERWRPRDRSQSLLILRNKWPAAPARDRAGELSQIIGRAVCPAPGLVANDPIRRNAGPNHGCASFVPLQPVFELPP